MIFLVDTNDSAMIFDDLGGIATMGCSFIANDVDLLVANELACDEA